MFFLVFEWPQLCLLEHVSLSEAYLLEHMFLLVLNDHSCVYLSMSLLHLYLSTCVLNGHARTVSFRAFLCSRRAALHLSGIRWLLHVPRERPPVLRCPRRRQRVGGRRGSPRAIHRGISAEGPWPLERQGLSSVLLGSRKGRNSAANSTSVESSLVLILKTFYICGMFEKFAIPSMDHCLGTQWDWCGPWCCGQVARFVVSWTCMSSNHARWSSWSSIILWWCTTSSPGTIWRFGLSIAILGALTRWSRLGQEEENDCVRFETCGSSVLPEHVTGCFGCMWVYRQVHFIFRTFFPHILKLWQH